MYLPFDRPSHLAQRFSKTKYSEMRLVYIYFSEQQHLLYSTSHNTKPSSQSPFVTVNMNLKGVRRNNNMGYRDHQN